MPIGKMTHSPTFWRFEFLAADYSAQPGEIARLKTSLPDYFSWLEMLLNVVFNFVPRPLTTAMIATDIPAAIRPYSMAVAPLSSSRNRWASFFILRSSYCYFSCEEMLLNALLSDVPMEFTAVTITIEIPAAISAYSILVAAASSFAKRVTSFRMGALV
jgi:hypothetical protein